MLNKEKHQLIMGRILRDIYSDATIAPLMGLKGGTCAYFFYGLPRFSADLAFDLFTTDEETQKLIFEKVKSILGKYGEVKDSHIKRFTIFFLLSYGDADHNIKVETNIRKLIPNLKALNYETGHGVIPAEARIQQFREIFTATGFPLPAFARTSFAGMTQKKVFRNSKLSGTFLLCYTMTLSYCYDKNIQLKSSVNNF